MSRLSWGDPGTKFYESGCDRGAIYVDGVGAAFPGLINVSEASTGGDVTPRYYDGHRYMNETSVEEFEGEIEAFYSPELFDACDGSLSLRSGFSATQQMRKEFHLTYRTNLGDDLNGPNANHKIHLVYNALATPSQRTRRAVSSQFTPDTMSWQFVTRPVFHPQIVPTAHFVLDTSKASEFLTGWLENQLYGTSRSAPRMPSIGDILGIAPGAYGTALYNVDVYE